MRTFFKSIKGKIISIILAVVLVSGAISGYFLFKDKPKSLKFDYEKGAIASSTVENAQYLPDIEKYATANNVPLSSKTISGVKDTTLLSLGNSTAGLSSSAITNEEEFANLIDEYAKIDNYAGAGKYLGYDIYEIKNEIKFVVNNVPAFNQWFRMPIMREQQGYVHIPYYENWAYYLEIGLEPSMLSITRVCWSTRSSYLDFSNNTIIEEHGDGTSFVQYEIMKINYYTNSEEDEVVECFLYSVGIDNVESGAICNKNTQDYYPFEYQYLKNVKDKSLIKYHITAAKRYKAMDIRGLNPYGVRREFTIVNYAGYKNIEMTQIDQKFATLDNITADGSVSFEKESDNIQMLVNNVGLPREEYEGSIDSYSLMNIISKHIVDNFELKNNWAQIYQESTDAIKIELIEGPFYGKNIPISHLNVSVGCRDWSKQEIEFSAFADIYDLSKFDMNTKYSLSMALKSRTTGKLYIVGTNYQNLSRVQYAGSSGLEEDDCYYRFEGICLNLSTSIINLDEDGEYDITCVLTVKNGDEDTVIFDTLEIGYLQTYYGLIIPDSMDDKGITHSYKVNATGGKLTIIASTKVD